MSLYYSSFYGASPTLFQSSSGFTNKVITQSLYNKNKTSSMFNSKKHHQPLQDQFHEKHTDPQWQYVSQEKFHHILKQQQNYYET